MSVPTELLSLIERFQRNLDQYKDKHYNETQVRVDYINPFFELLGWDVTNKSGEREQARDVVHEDKVKVGKKTKAPDYSFRIGGTRKFFLEAKKPSVDLNTDVGPTFQLRRYAWSAKLPVSILTDFEEFAVYDCRFEPNRFDKPTTARLMYFTFDQYAERWEEIAHIFHKESILRGSLDQYAESTKKKRGTAQVDDAFLAEIESWREMLAKNIALRNKEITTRELNHAVQATIDRIIFLRIAEDRGVEEYGRLLDLRNGTNIYPRLVDIYRLADNRYNSGLFHFSEEKGRGGTPDDWTTALQIDDKPLKEIFRRLYYPDSPYEFSVLPGSILGHVYEQFLGKVIRLTSGHQAKVEEKPEVRKAGGVFYTPDYITRHIVKETVGKLVEGKTPKEISSIRVLDPACGSGSFLLAAYDFLLNWHVEWYNDNSPEKHAQGKTPAVYRAVSSDPETPPSWKLTTWEKKRVLLNNIYGVDIDSQAVEVTKLSLLLRVLEDENEQTIGVQTSFAERILPDLENNIKCGNSLIGPEFYEKEQLSAFDEETLYRINVFDWQGEFREVMKEGGFDAVIGNPPYIRIQHMKEWAPLEVEFYKTAYRSAGKGNYDIYVVFVEKGLQLLKQGGQLGYILPHKFFNAQYGAPLREIIGSGDHLRKVIHFGDAQIFSGATTYTCLLFLSKEPNAEFEFEKVSDLESWSRREELGEEAEDIEAPASGLLPLNDVGASEWNFIIGSGQDLFRKLSEMPVKLGAVASNIYQGLVTSADPIYTLSIQEKVGNYWSVYSSHLDQTFEVEDCFVKPLLKKHTIDPFGALPLENLIIFPYRSGKIIEWEEIQESAPQLANYLFSCRDQLVSREKGKMNHTRWHAYVYPKNLTLFDDTKIIVQVISQFARYTIDSTSMHFTGGGNGPYYGIQIKSGCSIGYICGLLNSSLLDFYLHCVSSTFRGGYFTYGKQYIEQLPIRTIDFTNPRDVSQHDQMVRLVQTMLDLHKRLAAAKTGHDKNLLQRQIEATDRQIDRLVYELYELSEDEIAVVEGTNQ